MFIQWFLNSSSVCFTGFYHVAIPHRSVVSSCKLLMTDDFWGVVSKGLWKTVGTTYVCSTYVILNAWKDGLNCKINKNMSMPARALLHSKTALILRSRADTQEHAGDPGILCYWILRSSFKPCFAFLSSSGQKQNCGRRCHLKRGRRIPTRWILRQNHGCVSASKLYEL